MGNLSVYLLSLSSLFVFTACQLGYQRGDQRPDPVSSAANGTAAQAQKTSQNKSQSTTSQSTSQNCRLIEDGYGASGTVALQVETVVSGLEVPWGLAFLPAQAGQTAGNLLVTERPGRLRLVRNGQLVPEPILSLAVADAGEGGLLGLVLHPDFTSNRLFYVYYTAGGGERLENRVARYRLGEDSLTATLDRVIIDHIPAARIHDGGRIRFGPDRMLYISTGDAGESARAQDVDSLAGKILRMTPDGGIPADNPFADSPVYIRGIRNSEAFDWLSDERMIIADHGPSGELGRSGHDEVSVVGKGANLGWPDVWRCEQREGMVTPLLVWRSAAPPGGGSVYRGDKIPQWSGSFIMGTLGSRHLQQISVTGANEAAPKVEHAVYLKDAYGRLRTIVSGPDGALYVTTSNCDGRGDCGAQKDLILRITQKP